MNPTPTQICLVAAMFVLNIAGTACLLIVRGEAHRREVAELTARAEAPTRYTLSSCTKAGVTGPRFVSESELMEAYLRQVEATLQPGESATLLKVRR